MVLSRYGSLPITPGVTACQGAVIDISWSDRKLEKNCSSDKAGARKWGNDHWTLIRRRLTTLRGAPTLQDMEGAPGKCHALGADRHGQFAVSLWGQFRLIFVPNHDPIPHLDAGGVDRSLVTKISITEVADYHGD